MSDPTITRADLEEQLGTAVAGQNGLGRQCPAAISAG